MNGLNAAADAVDCEAACAHPPDDACDHLGRADGPQAARARREREPRTAKAERRLTLLPDAPIDQPFLVLAHGLHAVAHAINCEAACAHLHDGHGCEQEGHSCDCRHSESYDFDWDPDGYVGEHWSEAATAGLLQFLGRLDASNMTVEEIETRLEWWWRGENHALRKAMEKVHRTRCARGKGELVNVVTGQTAPARCKSWRECSYCAWVYGVRVERLFEQVKRLRAFVVFTMPPELGDPFNKDHLKAQAKAMRRLAERLYRCFGHRFAMLWTREHNTKRDGPGRLHLNVLWDEEWVDQAWLSETAKACGFGAIVDISRIGATGRHALRNGPGRGRGAAPYATKCLRYASKDLASQADWPKFTRRWGASKAARAQMSNPARNPDWFYAPHGVPGGFNFDLDGYQAVAVSCTCRTIPCRCGAIRRTQLASRPAAVTATCSVCRGSCEWCADPAILVCGRCHPPPMSWTHRQRSGSASA